MNYIIGLIIYVFVLLVIGFVLSKRNPDFDSYFFGQRKLGSFLIFFTVTASWFGAASTIATVNAAYKIGYNAIWMLGIPTIFTIIVFVLINKKVRETHFISLPVLLEKYYGKPVAAFASFLIFFYMVVLAASQLVAWGTFISHFTGQSYAITVITGALVIIIYSYLGGYLSVVITDAVQFSLIVAALVYLMVFFKDSTPLMLSTDYDLFANSHYNILMTLSFTLAWLISPIIWQRIGSAKSSRSSKWGLIMSIVAFSILYYMVIQVGIQMRSYPQTATAGGDLLGALIKNWLPMGGSVLVFLGIAAAIMSTADTALNVGALTLVKDVFQVKKKTRAVFWAKIATAVCGGLAILIALKFNSIIKTLGLASEIMAEGLFIPGMVMLFFKQKRPLAALFSLILGGGFSLLVFINAYGLSLPLPQWPYSLPLGLGLSLFGFVVGYLIDGRKRKGREKMN